MDMRKKIDEIKKGELPNHVAIIPDGNGRWASREGKTRTEGHKKGVKVTEEIIKFVSRNLPLKYLTLYTFSTENWERPRREVKFLMKLLRNFLKRKKKELIENNLQIKTIGNLSKVPEKTCKTVQDVVESTAENDGLTVTMALNYGGRQEIIGAINKIFEELKSEKNLGKKITEEIFEDHLYTSGIPHPDLLIRTSGEDRISNFMLWQIAYTEFWRTETLWPDFSPAEFIKAIDEYQSRNRRYGKVKEGKLR